LRVFHNSVVSTQAPFSSIEWRFSNTQAEITNNLCSHRLLERDGAGAALAGNLENAPVTLFANPLAGDLHLAPGASLAIDQGSAIPDGLADEDMDGDRRPTGAGRDVGADELSGPEPVWTDWIYLPVVVGR
jgi:hypothetical protein